MGINVLSLFDGLSGGRIALKKAGIKVDNYYASEIDKYAIKVAQSNWPENIQIGNVLSYNEWELPKIDLLIGGSPCFAAGTKILTNKGYKNIEEIKINDEVLTHNNRFKKVTDFGASFKKIISIKAQGALDIKTTENHPFYIKRKNKKEKEAEWIKVKDIELGDFACININNKSENIYNLDEEDCWLIGRYIADGHYRKEKRKNRKNSYQYQLIISIGKGKEEEFKKNITKRHYSFYDHTKSVKRAVFSSMDLVNLIEDLGIGKGALNKKIPLTLINLPKKLLGKVLEGYFSGDGYINDKGKCKFNTISKELALSLSDAILKCYNTPAMLTTYIPEKTKKIENRIVNQNILYEGSFFFDNEKRKKLWFIEDDKVWLPIKSKFHLEEDFVYNLTVEEDNTYTANNIIVHNCQDLSRIKSKDGKGLDGEKSKLFYTYFHTLRKFKPKYFLLENVVMDKEYEDIITELLGVEPILLDSGDFSAQNRPRLYWTNINFDKSKKHCNLKIHDIMEIGKIEEKHYIKDPYKWHGMKNKIVANLDTHNENGKRKYMDTTARVYNINHKSPTLTAVCGGGQHKKIFDGVGIRRLTPLEYERLQTVPDNYTDCVSDSQRYKMLGNGWTVDVIAHIFKGLK